MFEKNSLKQTINGNNNTQVAGDIINYYSTSKFSSLPKMSKGYIERNEEENGILEKLEQEKILIIYGFSGMGKTAISIAVANKICSEFESVLFIDGKNISFGDTIIYNRTEYAENLEALLLSKKVLLVVDNLENNAESICDTLLGLNLTDSRVIITLKNKKYLRTENIHSLRKLDIEDCRKILFQDIGIPKKNDQLLNDFFHKISYMPLILKLLNKAILYDGLNLDDFIGNIEEVLQMEDIESNIAVFNRIIESLNISDSMDTIEILAWLDTLYYDNELLKYMIGSAKFQRFNVRGIFDDTESINQYTVKIHEILLCSIKEKVKDLTIDETKIEEKFLEYFTRKMEMEDDKYFNALFMHKEKLHNICDHQIPFGEKMYLFLKSAVDNDIEQKNIDFNSIDFNSQNNYQDKDFFVYLSFIEYVERKGSIIRRENNEKYKAFINDSISKYMSVLKKDKLSIRLSLILEHHLGKLYSRNNQEDLAIKCFEKNIVNDASKLQLIRLLYKDNPELSKKYIKDILEKRYTGNFVETTVLLATLEELSKNYLENERKIYIIDKFPIFKQIILESSNFYFDQPFRVFVRIGKKIKYLHPNLYYEIAKDLPIKISDNIVDDGILFAVGEYFKDLYEVKLDLEKKQDFVLLDQSEKYYSKMHNRTSFHNQMYAVTKLLKKDYLGAIEILAILDDKFGFVDYRLAQAYLGLNKYDDSIKYIDRAIEKIEQTNTDSYKSTMYKYKGEIFYHMKNPKYEEYYNLAIEKCSNEKFLDNLKKELAEYKGKFMEV